MKASALARRIFAAICDPFFESNSYARRPEIFIPTLQFECGSKSSLKLEDIALSPPMSQSARLLVRRDRLRQAVGKSTSCRRYQPRFLKHARNPRCQAPNDCYI